MGGPTEKQKEAVRNSWTKIVAGWQTNGPEFFIR